MIIESLSIQNFLCYSGRLTNNSFEFKPGLNIVVGKNGSGKSKMYDAFYWLFYDRIFNSHDRIFESTQQVGVRIVSDSAKADCEVGSRIETIVELKVSELKRGATTPIYYILRKTLVIEKLESKPNYNDASIWKIHNVKKEVLENSIVNFKPMTGHNDFDRIAQKIIPKDMTPYLWFQGEQVDSLIDFKNEDSLTQAIDVLSGIRIYDYYNEIADKVSRAAKTAFNTERRRKGNLDESKVIKQDRSERLQILIDGDQEALKHAKRNLNIAEESKKELLGKIDDAKELNSLQSKIDQQEYKIAALKNDLSGARKGFNNNLFVKKWLLRNAKPYFEKFELRLKDYDDRRDEIKMQFKLEEAQEIAVKNRLPENVPNKRYLDIMLKEKTCFLCGRDFEENDVAHNHISGILANTQKQRFSFTSVLKNDFKKNYQALYNNGYHLSNYVIDGIDESIGKELERLDELQNKLETGQREFGLISEQVKHLVNTGSVSQKEAEEINSSFTQYLEDQGKFTNQEREIKIRLKENKEELDEINKELDKVSNNDMDPQIVLKKEVLEKFYQITQSTRESVYEEQIKKIEKEANVHFSKMTEDNDSVRGSIILDKIGDSYMPRNIDKNGIELTNPNDSNIILIKVATILAIVTAKGNTENHPLISDAPTAKFDPDYKFGFYKTVSDVFSQSIIFTFDFYHSMREKLFEEIDNLGSIYVIDPANTGADRMTRTELSTVSEKIN